MVEEIDYEDDARSKFGIGLLVCFIIAAIVMVYQQATYVSPEINVNQYLNVTAQALVTEDSLYIDMLKEYMSDHILTQEEYKNLQDCIDDYELELSRELLNKTVEKIKELNKPEGLTS